MYGVDRCERQSDSNFTWHEEGRGEAAPGDTTKHKGGVDLTIHPS
jgi:hypothetical protein